MKKRIIEATAASRSQTSDAVSVDMVDGQLRTPLAARCLIYQCKAWSVDRDGGGGPIRNLTKIYPRSAQMPDRSRKTSVRGDTILCIRLSNTSSNGPPYLNGNGDAR